jgi:hypothetical protein
MHVQLSFKEVRELRRLLKTTLGDLRVEIRHSRGAETKTLMKRREAIIRDLLGKLNTEEQRVANGVFDAFPRNIIDT